MLEYLRAHPAHANESPLITGLALTVALCSLIVAATCFVLTARNREPANRLLIALGVVEALLAVQAIIAVIIMIASGAPESLLTFIAYLVASLLVLPLGTAWALAERSRSSTAVLGVACVTVPVLVLRLHEIWTAPHA